MRLTTLCMELLVDLSFYRLESNSAALFRRKNSGKMHAVLVKIQKETIFAIPKKNGMVVQLVRMPPCHGGGRGFESRPFRP